MVVDSPNTELICEVFGIPTPSVEWVSTAARVQMGPIVVTPGSVEGRVRGVLTLSQPADLDEGNYTCVGSNALGAVSQTIRVVVQSKSPWG